MPKEINKILSSMNDNTTFMSIDEVEKILKKKLPPENFALIQELSPEPIAAASIGQVHSAIYKGRDVAIKVQYPKVDRTIDTDLDTLKRLMQTFIRFTKKNIKIDDTFEEIKKNLRREVNYILEAQQLKKYRDFFKAEKDYIVPQVVDELSTRHVLTMTLESGDKIRDYLASPDLDSAMLARLILNLLQLEFFTYGLVQTDPNPGNFLIQPKNKRLVLLDLGSNKQYSKAFRKRIIKLLRITMHGSDGELIDYAHSLGILDPRESQEAAQSLIKLMKLIISMYLPAEQPFEFGSEDYLRSVRDGSIEFIKSVKYTNPQKELIFLNRKLGGMFHILKDAKSIVDLTSYWNAVLDIEKKL